MGVRLVCQIFLWLFSSLVFLGGLVFGAVALGAYFLPDFSTVYLLIAPTWMQYTIWGIGAIGLIATFVSFLGCYSLCDNNRCTITIYWLALIIIGAPVVVGSVLLYIKNDQVKAGFVDTLNGFKLQPNESYFTPFLNFEEKYQCCGIDTPNSNIQNDGNSDCYDWKDQFPAGCQCDPRDTTRNYNGTCLEIPNQNQFRAITRCNQDAPNNNWKGVYANGCRNDLLASFDDITKMLSIVGLAVGAVFLLAAFCSTCVCVCCGKNERCCGVEVDEEEIIPSESTSLSSASRTYTHTRPMTRTTMHSLPSGKIN